MKFKTPEYFGEEGKEEGLEKKESSSTHWRWRRRQRVEGRGRGRGT